ncbi:unnamed protein product [Heligmosomoides polygyrus]|uniref:Reverse transcriptase domain-containing protein n=1 Tax=Heligmosomoides polygyrus TaxID=6339 RepID=A0A183GEK2_HELPZ|nr:unnamed protein product [Heligmosomoides polygyrus]
MMKIVAAAKERLYHFFSAYVPQIGCSDQAKDKFWSLLDEMTAKVPSKDVIVVAGDLNGQVGATKDGNQCGFVAGCGTVDAMHAACLLVEKHREKQEPVHIAFLNLEKAFDRVPLEVIWYALLHNGVPKELIEWVRTLYSCPKSRVQAAAGTSMEFPIFAGVHQGSALSPLLFDVVMDATTRHLQKVVPWTLLYADDVMLTSEDKGGLEREVQAWCDRLECFGLRLNVKKTEYLMTDVTEFSSIKVNDIKFPRTSVFNYMGSAIASDGKLMVEVNSRVSAAWSKWRSFTSVLCDSKMSERMKSKIYRAVVRPVAMYGAERWPATKEVETRLSAYTTIRLRTCTP